MLTSFYLSLLAMLFIKISMETIKTRIASQTSLGTGEDPRMIGMVSAHSNFQSYIPIIALLMYFYEISSWSNQLVLHALGLSVLAGRFLHYLGVRNAKAQIFKFRVAGMRLTIIPLMILAALNFAHFAYTTRFAN